MPPDPTDSSPMSPGQHRVFAMILAAGQGRRMGQLKQLLPYQQSTILEAVVAAVVDSSVDGLVVVTNPLVAGAVKVRLPEDCALAVNHDPESEMLTSVKLGLSKVVTTFHPAPTDGVLILLGDQPQITGGVITTCAEAFRLPKHPPGILIATYRGRRGHPAVFTVQLLREIVPWSAERRLNELAELHPQAVRELAIFTAPMPVDVNTPEDYKLINES